MLQAWDFLNFQGIDTSAYTDNGVRAVIGNMLATTGIATQSNMVFASIHNNGDSYPILQTYVYDNVSGHVLPGCGVGLTHTLIGGHSNATDHFN